MGGCGIPTCFSSSESEFLVFMWGLVKFSLVFCFSKRKILGGQVMTFGG